MSKLIWYVKKGNHGLVVESHACSGEEIHSSSKFYIENKGGFLEWFVPENNSPSVEELNALRQKWSTPKKHTTFKVEIYD